MVGCFPSVFLAAGEDPGAGDSLAGNLHPTTGSSIANRNQGSMRVEVMECRLALAGAPLGRSRRDLPYRSGTIGTRAAVAGGAVQVTGCILNHIAPRGHAIRVAVENVK